MIRPTRIRVTVFCLAYLAHAAAALFYYNLVKNGVADSALYYYDPLRTYEEGFGFNTAFIIYLVQLPKSLFGGTYLDYFFVFQAAGFLGLCLLMRTIEEIYAEVDTPQPVYTYLLLFMPSLHYWTSAIGKDSLFFLGICLSIWAAMQYKQRLIALSGGLLLMLAVRPHIAVIAAGAFAMAVMVDRRTRLIIKLPLFLLSIAGAAFAVVSVWSTFRIDLTNVDALSEMMAGREAFAGSEDAGRTAVNAGYPIRLLSLLFRPFFFDGGGALGLIVSFENLLFLVIVVLIVFHLRTMTRLARNVASSGIRLFARRASPSCWRSDISMLGSVFVRRRP
jgi:hypothetical protein